MKTTTFLDAKCYVFVRWGGKFILSVDDNILVVCSLNGTKTCEVLGFHDGEDSG
jgi:hypothetical protein